MARSSPRYGAIASLRDRSTTMPASGVPLAERSSPTVPIHCPDEVVGFDARIRGVAPDRRQDRARRPHRGHVGLGRARGVAGEEHDLGAGVPLECRRERGIHSRRRHQHTEYGPASRCQEWNGGGLVDHLAATVDRLEPHALRRCALQRKVHQRATGERHPDLIRAVRPRGHHAGRVGDDDPVGAELRLELPCHVEQRAAVTLGERAFERGHVGRDHGDALQRRAECGRARREFVAGRGECGLEGAVDRTVHRRLRHPAHEQQGGTEGEGNHQRGEPEDLEAEGRNPRHLVPPSFARVRLAELVEVGLLPEGAGVQREFDGAPRRQRRRRPPATPGRRAHARRAAGSGPAGRSKA